MYNDYFQDYGVTEFTIEESRKELNKVVAWFRSQIWHEDAMQACIVETRQLPMSVADKAECFFIPESLDEYDLPEFAKESSLGLLRFGRIIQTGRLVYPVKDVMGDVMGFCGWDLFAQPKYLDSKNYGYKAKYSTLYGMEELPTYYANDKPVYVVEGIVCCLWLRSKGFQALALLGSSMTSYVTEILKRFGSRLIVIPDNDDAGNSLVKSVKYKLKKAIIVQVSYGKDIDGCRRVEDNKYEQLLIEELSSLSNPFVRTSLLIRR